MNVKSIAIIASMLCVCMTAFSQTQVTYQPDETNFPNPERGFYHHKEVRSVAYVNLSREELLRYRSQGATLIMRVCYLESFVNSDISAEYLENMRRDFAIARETGIKLLVRFAYTQKTIRPVGDATPAWVLAHIDQLKDVLVQNGDVIALVQAGFIGAWGEWYYTDHFSQVIGLINDQNWIDRIAMVNALLDAVPEDRTVQLRMPLYKRKVTGIQEALTVSEAFTGTNRARIGHHNDCFLASSNDVGTYVNVEEEKNYLEQETYFVPLGGETCGVNVPRSQCPTAIAEMARLHWSYLNMDYYPQVITGFQDGGCMPDIEKKLGYRFRLTSGEFQTNSAPAGELKINVALVNDGWANPYNKRYVEFVLRHKTSGKEYFFRTNQDPRKWSLSGATTIESTVGLPAAMEEGDYELLINLPDPKATLYRNPGYSIRLANQQLWEESSGYNKLNVIVNVDHDHNVPVYSGSDFFLAKNVSNAALKPSPLLSSSSANKVMLYWGIDANDGARVIERAVDGGPFQEIATLEGTQQYFFDETVTAGSNYQYRYHLQRDNEFSAPTPVVNEATEVTNPDFRNFVSDGEIDEWNVVLPLATGFVGNKTLSLRLFSDRDKLNILLEGAANKKYTVFLDTDENESTGIAPENMEASGFDYCVRNDSLFEAQAQQWKFVSKLTAALAAAGVEVSVPMSSFINLGDNMRIKTAALLEATEGNTTHLPDVGDPTRTHIRLQPANPPTSLVVSNSEATPESRLVISWENECIQCRGFVLERSESPGEGFSEIFRTTSATIYRDDNLSVNKTYYYRIYAFNETGKSDYTPVGSGTTYSSVTGIEQAQQTTQVYPVPADNILTIETESVLHAVAVFDVLGHRMATREAERHASGRQVKIDLSSLAAGVYILRIHAGDQIFPYRISKK